MNILPHRYKLMSNYYDIKLVYVRSSKTFSIYALSSSYPHIARNMTDIPSSYITPLVIDIISSTDPKILTSYYQYDEIFD